MSKLTNEEIQAHSLIAFEKWKDLWIGNCKRNKGKIQTRLKDIAGCFNNKKAFCFAYGPSFKRNVEEFKALNLDRSQIVVGCVDKAFRPLVEMGVFPDCVLIADGSVDAKKWLVGIPDEAIERSFLISNVYGSPEWAEHWAERVGCKRIFWYLNKDNIPCTHNNKLGTAEFFGPLVDYYDVIEAASNVGNSLVVMMNKILWCKEIFLYGYDYSWEAGQYYGTGNENKYKWFPHSHCLDADNKLVFATSNMEFSSGWLDQYISYSKSMFNVDITNLTGAGILKNGRMMANV